MAIRGIYYHLGLTTLQAKLAANIAERDAMRSGTAAISYGVGGKSFSVRRAAMEELDKDIDEILAQLRRLDPTTYGKRVTVTAVDFSANSEFKGASDE